MSPKEDLRTDTAAKDLNVEKLSDCMRREISAVETYELAMKDVTHVGIHHTLQEICASHVKRTEQLREAIRALGGDPPGSSGVWGAFARAVQTGADLLGDRAAMAALEEGEDQELALYSGDFGKYNAETQRIIERELLPQQRHTHDLCRTLKSYTRAPS